MFKQKNDDYLASLNRARRKRNRGDYRKYALIAAGAVVLIAGAVFFGSKLKNREAANVPETAQTEETAGPEDPQGPGGGGKKGSGGFL